MLMPVERACVSCNFLLVIASILRHFRLQIYAVESGQPALGTEIDDLAVDNIERH